MVQSLSSEFHAEIKTKQDNLDVTQAHLRAATRELSEQRKQIQAWQARCGDLDQVTQRIRNLDKALGEEDQIDWTGRTGLGGQDMKEVAGPAFAWRGPNSSMLGHTGGVDVSFAVDPEPPMPAGDSPATLIRLRRLKMWHVRMEELVQARLGSLRGASAEKEYMCKKIVALCTGIPVDKIEEVRVHRFKISGLSISHLWNIYSCWEIWLSLSKARRRLWISDGCPGLCKRCGRLRSSQSASETLILSPPGSRRRDMMPARRCIALCPVKLSFLRNCNMQPAIYLSSRPVVVAVSSARGDFEAKST
jgi:hypothetical protein